jgi:hypothetical protein
MNTQFVQTLESRMLLTATPNTLVADELVLAADVKTLHADLKAYAPAYKADVKTLADDLRALPKSPANVLLLNKLRTDQNKCAATLRADFAHLMAVDRPAIHKLTVDAFRVFLHPTDATAQAKLAADIAAFQANGAAPLAQFTTDLAACGQTLAADADALVAANPTATKLATDLDKTKADASAAATTIQADVTKGQADLTKLLTDLSA